MQLALLDFKVPRVHKDLKVTPVPLVLLELRAQLVLWGLPAQLDLRVPPVPKDLKETQVQPALLGLRARLGPPGPLAQQAPVWRGRLGQWDQRVRLGRAPQVLVDQQELLAPLEVSARLVQQDPPAPQVRQGPRAPPG